MNKQACSERGCKRPARTRGMCGAHYQYAWSHGTIEVDRRHQVCKVAGCDRFPVAHALCGVHRQRLAKHGTTELHPMPSGKDHSQYRHGLTGTRTWRCWVAMKGRCLNEGNSAYPRYGGKGISVHPPWIESFEVFFEDMGQAPSEGHSLQRIDGKSSYEPGNVRWATASDQARSRSTNRLITWDGVTLTLADWSEKLGVPYGALQARLDLGWSTHRAFTQPVRRLGNRPVIIPNQVDRTTLMGGQP